MIFRLEYGNRFGDTVRIDITTPGLPNVVEIEGTGDPFRLKYTPDKSDKSFRFLTSSAEINIYETSEFNIDKLKTSSETDIKVDYYINGVKEWTGYVLPDFFSREIGGNAVVSMVASDRISTLKGVTLSDLPAMVSIRDLAVRCLAKTGLDLPLKTMVDFSAYESPAVGFNDFFRSEIPSQRLVDNKGRSISCYDTLKSILVASNSELVQRNAEWLIVNKLQHEIGEGKLYSSPNTRTDYSEVTHNFSEITKGAIRTIIPVAASVGVYHEYGGGRTYPENSDFSHGLSGWTKFNGFDGEINNKEVSRYIKDLFYWLPSLGGVTEKNNLRCNRNAFNPKDKNNPYIESLAIDVTYPESSSIEVTADINAISTGAFIAAKSYINYAVIAKSPSGTLYSLDGSGSFTTFTDVPFVQQTRVLAKESGAAATISNSVKGVLAIEDGDLEGFKVYARIYGSGIAFTPFINSVSVSFTQPSVNPMGLIYKREQGDNFTKSHDIETSIIGDYVTNGFNGFFYPYTNDDTSSLYDPYGNLRSKWTDPTDPNREELPLLQHVVRQNARMFSVAHDKISGEIEMVNFDPLAIFVDCYGTRYSLVSAEVDFLRSNVKIEIEEIAYRNLTVRDFIYSYFGEGESGISSVGGIQAGSGGGSGGGMTADQINILNNLASWWKLDDDGNLFTELNVYSEKEISAYGVGSGGSGGGGTFVEWGTQFTTFAVELTVEGVKKTLALSSHAHDVYSITGLASALNNKQDKLTAGTGITISGNTISATGGGGTTVSWGSTSNNYSPLIVEGVTKTVALSGHTHAWGDVTGKPSTFAPSSHSHPFTDITGTATTAQIPNLPASKITSGTFDIARIPTGTTSSTVSLGNHTHAYSTLTGIPSTFTPNAHTHGATDITSGTFAIERIPTGTTASTVSLGNHTHSYNSLTGIPSTFTPSSHTHSYGDINSITENKILGRYSTITGVAQLVSIGSNLTLNSSTGVLSATDTVYTHPTSGVTAGTYKSVTVNNLGHVTSGTNPTTLSGYGITDAVPSNRTVSAGNGLTGGGALSSNITLTLGTPSTLTATTTNSVTASSHTHSIKTTSVGASNTIVQTDANGAVRGAKLMVGADWSFELSGTELQIKRGGTITQRFLADGSIVGMGEVTAYGAGTGGDGVALLRSGGTMTGDLILDANLGASNKALTLLGNSFKYNNSDVLTEANTANNITTNKITLGNGWTIEQTSASLTIRRNGVVKGTFNA